MCSEEKDLALMNVERENPKKTRNLWVGDSGATHHIVCKDENLINWVQSDEEVEAADSGLMRVEKIGMIQYQFKDENREVSEVIIEDVKFIPNLRLNLFNIPLGMMKGWNVELKGTISKLKKEEKVISFHKKFRKGRVFFHVLKNRKGRAGKEEQRWDLCGKPQKQYNFKAFHDLVGHASLETTRKTAQRLGIKLTGTIKTCEDCLLPKMRKKKINKTSNGKSRISGERLLIDLSYIKRQSLGGKDTWLLIEDQFTSMKWIFFMRRKGGLIDKTI